jgi:predicted neutral ceramidase superfamily lipid hydrolase
MKISEYLGYILKDFFLAYGCLIAFAALCLNIYSIGAVDTSLLCQLMLAASSYTFFKFALVNKYELSKTAQMISFYICFILADMMILIWLWFFSPGKIMNRELTIMYFIIILVVKGGVYAMMHIDGRAQAKKVNEKLSEYNSDENE